jgi:hypothetical protein
MADFSVWRGRGWATAGGGTANRHGNAGQNQQFAGIRLQWLDSKSHAM